MREFNLRGRFVGKRHVLASLFLLILVSVLMSTFSTSNVHAWSNGGYSAEPSSPDYGTHDWIAQHALDWLPTEEKQYISDNLAAYLYGTELPDNGEPLDGIGDFGLHHIYYNSLEVMIDDASAVRASTEYNDTLNFLKAEDYVDAAKNAGIMSHYIVDMAVFGHVMGANTEWGAESQAHHSDYEDYVNAQTSNYSGGEFDSYLAFDGSVTVISAYDAAKNLAYDTTFDVNGDLNCTWMNQNYNWSNPIFKNRAGESLNLAVNYLIDVLHTLFLDSTGLPTEAFIDVPYHRQLTNYYCGPASLEMVFDYFGPDISQHEIAEVSRTADYGGTFQSDLVRAAHFSNLSTSDGMAMVANITGYTARKLGYAACEYYGMTITELRSVIVAGYPIIVMTPHHFRVAVGYDGNHIIFQDSYQGPLTIMTYNAFDSQWDWSGHSALLVCPWTVKVSFPTSIFLGDIFNVTATISYPLPPPFPTYLSYPASMTTAMVTLPDGLVLVSGETLKKVVGTGYLTPGSSESVTWTVRATSLGDFDISVEAEGRVTISYFPSDYEDRIGGFGQNTVHVVLGPDDVPPITSPNYDGLWHNADFEITLSAVDNAYGQVETYYRINDGAVQNVSIHGQPRFTVEGANNKLEYWSVDLASNVENHHTLTGIKLDKTAPIGSITVNQGETYATTTTITLSLSAEDLMSGVSEMRFSNDNNTYTTWQTYDTSKLWTLENGDGMKTVYVQYKDKAGSISSYSHSIILDTKKPTANAGADQTIIEDTTVAFDASTSFDENGISTYTWTFLDVTMRTLIGEKPTYIFSTPGVYPVTLNVSDAAGNWATDTVSITILDVTAPTAIAGNNQTVQANTPAAFDGCNSCDNAGLVSYEWHFGDGSTGNGMTATHTYSQPGTYTVILVVRDSAGNMDADTLTVTVLAATEALPMWAIGIVALVIAAITIGAIVIRKRKT
jgi:PKD repeat protein